MKRVLVSMTFMLAVVPRLASAQQSDGWQFSAVPLYFWAANMDGHLSAGPATLPLVLEFEDAKDHLANAFSFHFEASRGRWGAFTDLNLIGLESTAPVGAGAITVTGDFDLDNTMFEAGGMYLLAPRQGFWVLAGVRTYTLGTEIAIGESTAVDTSDTSVDAIGGIVYRPSITDRWSFISRADIGAGGSTLTWGAVVGLEYRFTAWGGIDFGFKALGVDRDQGSNDLQEYDVTHYGPIVGLRLHWGQ